LTKLVSVCSSRRVSAKEDERMGSDWARPVVHFQITARDLPKQAEFYRRLFQWESGEDGLTSFASGLGGPEPGPGGNFRAGAESGIQLFIQVRDIEATTQLAAELGGRVKRAPVLTGGVTYAFIEDPEGNGLALVQQ